MTLIFMLIIISMTFDGRSHQAGIAETIDYVVKLYDASTQQQLVNNVFITGGCAYLPGTLWLVYATINNVNISL